MPLIHDTAVLQRIATLPLATYQPGETVLAAGYENRSLADPQEGRGCHREGGHGDCQGDGTRRCIRRAVSVAESAVTVCVAVFERHIPAF